MPKNTRNSREDKSENFNRAPKRPGIPSSKPGYSKPERTDSSNTDKRKKFGDDSEKRPGRDYKRPDSQFKGAAKPFVKKEGGREKSSFSERPKNTERSFNKPDGDKFNRDKNTPFRKREPLGGKFDKAEGKFDKGKPSGTRPFEKREGARSYKPRPDAEKRPFRKDSRSEERGSPKPGLRAKREVSKDDGLIRLNRYISNAGICSRRKADELIEAGVVSVNGQPVSELGFKVNPKTDVIRYNGEVLKREKMVYVLLNKPKDYITTTDDPHERHTVMQLVAKASNERIYPVGRLDRNTTGLLLLTNDGDLTDKLSHPKNNITKIYNVELNKGVSQGDLNKIAYGLELEDGLIKPDDVRYVEGGSKREVGIQIHSGKNRIVRRIFEHLGYEVVKLDRVIYANLTKKDLPRGKWRFLEEKEVIQLKHLI